MLSLALASCGTGSFDGSASGTLSSATEARVNLRLARAARAAGDAAGAADLYRTLAAGPSATPELLVEAADALAGARYYDDAIAIYGRVGGRAKLAALLGLVRAHIALGDNAQALQAADQALALAPRDARVLVNRGVVLDSVQRHAEAQASYRSALQIAPRSISARNNLALSLALVGQYDAAIALMVRLAQEPSATPKIRENLALIYGLSGNTERAAAISRLDLDSVRAAENLEFFARMRVANR